VVCILTRRHPAHLHILPGHTAQPENAPPPPEVKFGEDNPVDPSSPEMKAKLGKTTEASE